ncbi:MAG: NADH-quinone oxidoreductase subunit A [Candidatus Omnitrophota bacterium]|nr:NADH-quinone oxidoreductase subunit A [Candidatus Omnitrophota bacterium]
MYIIMFHMVINDYGFVGLFFILGIAFVAAALIVSWLLRPRDPNPAKTATYECGEILKGCSRVQFNVSYYLVALLFVIFDIEVLFLVPWATVFRELGPVAYIEMMVFIAILIFGLIYAWKKGVFEWQ